MQTYTHFLLTALANEQLKSRRAPVRSRALLLGSVLPDLPLLLLGLGFLAYRSWCGWNAPGDEVCGPRFNDLYFHNPFWKAGHNLFHAPVHLGLLAAAGAYFGRRQKKWGPALVWFAIAAGLHTLIDIFTHHDDGPLVFFPFNWEYRFPAPVSYWDPDHGGRIFAPLERLLALLILGVLAAGWLKRRRAFPPKKRS